MTYLDGVMENKLRMVTAISNHLYFVHLGNDRYLFVGFDETRGIWMFWKEDVKHGFSKVYKEAFLVGDLLKRVKGYLRWWREENGLVELKFMQKNLHM